MTEIPEEFSLPREALDRQRAVLSGRVGLHDRSSSLRRRRALVPALAVVVLAVAGAATAGGVHLWAAGPSAIDTNQATSLVQYTLTDDLSLWKKGDTLAVWRLPQPDGSVCIFKALASPKPSAPGTGPNPGGGGFCNE